MAAPGGANPWKYQPARYTAIGVAALLLILGLFALPWIQVSNGDSVTYPTIANAIGRSGGGGLNWWQHLYLHWFAVVLAVAGLAAVTVTVAVVTRRPPPAPLWTLAVCLLAFALLIGTFQAVPDLPYGAGSSSLLGPGSVGLGYLVLILVCPTRQRLPGAATTRRRS